jgi:hypothetical protein
LAAPENAQFRPKQVGLYDYLITEKSETLDGSSIFSVNYESAIMTSVKFCIVVFTLAYFVYSKLFCCGCCISGRQ